MPDEDKGKEMYDKVYKSASDVTKNIEDVVKPGSLEDFNQLKKCYEEFSNPESAHQQLLQNGVDYIFNGHHDEKLSKHLPGAKNKALQELDKLKASEDGKIEDREGIMRVLSTYMDEVLKHYYGEKGFEVIKEEIDKMKDYGKSEEEIFRARASKFDAIAGGRQPKHGNVSIESLLESLDGKKKHDAESILKEQSEIHKEAYLHNNAGQVMQKYLKQEHHPNWLGQARRTAKANEFEQTDTLAHKRVEELASIHSGMKYGFMSDEELKKHGFKKKEEAKKEEETEDLDEAA